MSANLHPTLNSRNIFNLVTAFPAPSPFLVASHFLKNIGLSGPDELPNMADSSVSDRRIRPIQDAISSGNWKQAAQLCDKWSKKGERSDRFLVSNSPQHEDTSNMSRL